MTDPNSSASKHRPKNSAHVRTLALSLGQAERAIHEFAAGQLDAIVDADGQTYLLRPAQNQLRQSERRLQAIIDSAADAIMVVSRRGVIVSQSQAVRRLLGFEPEELIGKNFFEIICDGDRTSLYTAFFHVVEGFEESAIVQFRHPTRDGAYRWIEANVSKLFVKDSASVVFCMRPMDMPRIPGLATPPPPAVAIPVSRAKDRFLAMIAHELRTPLTPVLLGVAELEEDARFAEARAVLAMIRRNIAVQTRLIEELTDFALVGEHKVRLRMEAIDLHDALRFVLEICRSEIANTKIDMRLDLGLTESSVIADSVRLQQVMWNLLKHAIKFSAPESGISIATSDGPPGQVSIEFIDHGIGIEAGLLPRIFDAFQQASLSEQRVRGGLGLGLFIAKGLAEAQGGTLTAQSEGRGKGATFRLTLPKAPPDRAISPTETDSRFFHPASHSASQLGRLYRPASGRGRMTSLRSRTPAEPKKRHSHGEGGSRSSSGNTGS